MLQDIISIAHAEVQNSKIEFHRVDQIVNLVVSQFMVTNSPM